MNANVLARTDANNAAEVARENIRSAIGHAHWTPKQSDIDALDGAGRELRHMQDEGLQPDVALDVPSEKQHLESLQPLFLRRRSSLFKERVDHRLWCSPRPFAWTLWIRKTCL